MTRLRHRIAFRGRVFHVDRDRVRLDNGRTATLDIVRHRGSVVIVAQPSRREVVLIRQYRYAIRKWMWELPAGSLDQGEAAAHAARRECMEEIGWRPARLERLATFFPTPGFCDERMVFYRCTDLTRPTRAVAHDPDEDIEPRVYTLAQACKLIEQRKIIDMKTVVGLGLIK